MTKGVTHEIKELNMVCDGVCVYIYIYIYTQTSDIYITNGVGDLMNAVDKYGQQTMPRVECFREVESLLHHKHFR